MSRRGSKNRFEAARAAEAAEEEAKRWSGGRHNPSIKLSDKYHSNSRHIVRCKICGSPTWFGKDYCPEHVEEQVYIKGLQNKISERELEEERVGQVGSGAISRNSTTLHDLLLQVDIHRKRSLLRLAKELKLSNLQVRAYVDYAEKNGLVKTVGGKRGNIFVIPPDKTLRASKRLRRKY